MIPAAFVTLDRAAADPQRQARPPGPARPRIRATARPGPHTTEPRTDAEQVIAGIWAEVLGVERVGAHDSFFQLGGDSILSIQVTARLRAAFGIQLSPRALFTHPTIAELAAQLPAAPGQTPAAATGAVPVIPRDGRPLPLSFAQQRLWFLDDFEPEHRRAT